MRTKVMSKEAKNEKKWKHAYQFTDREHDKIYECDPRKVCEKITSALGAGSVAQLLHNQF